MNRTKRSHSRRPPLFAEWLEPRIALSLAPFDAPQDAPLGPELSVVSTSPSDGSSFISPPGELVLTFDRPVDPGTVTFSDVLLDQVNSDGSLTPIFDPFNGVEEDLDDTGYVMTVPIGQSLAPGKYEVLLSGNSFLAGLDGSPLQNNFNDQVIATFNVTPPGAKLSDAIDLGELTSGASIQTSGVLDFVSNPFAVQLYKFEVPDGHFWRLGTSVDSQRIGSALNAGLTLFDAQGEPIASSISGRNDFPGDPYLFDGIGPGTYFIGVSAHGNIAGQPGGYNPVAGDPGTNGQIQPGGPFLLNVVTDTADTATSLINFQLNYVDPNNTVPIGMTLQFSGPLGLGNTASAVQQNGSTAVELVDASGRSWPIQLVSYDEANARVSFEFMDQLPAGNYTVRLPSQRELTDLAGRPVISPTMPAGVLATFSAGARQQPTDPSNLGVPSPNQLLAGLKRGVDLVEGQTVTYQLTNVYDDLFQLITTSLGGQVRVTVVNLQNGSTNTLAAGAPGQETNNLVGLGVGAYEIQLTAIGKGPIHLDWILQAYALQPDAILANGVGQGPALNLRLISPGVSDTSSGSITPVNPTGANGASSAPFPQSASASASPGNSGDSQTLNGNFPSFASARVEANSGGITPQGPAGLFLGVGGSLVGRPTNQNDAIAAVGPGNGGALASLASPGAGQGQSPSIQASLGPWLDGILDPSTTPGAINKVVERAPVDPRGGSIPLVATADSRSPEPDLALPDYLNVLRDMFRLKSNSNSVNGPATSTFATEFLADLDSPTGNPPSEPESGELEHAGFSAPLAAGIVAAIVARSHHSLHSWFGRGRRTSSPARSSFSNSRSRSTGPLMRTKVGMRPE
jgi:methionine-rich copper-binding protein CopC